MIDKNCGFLFMSSHQICDCSIKFVSLNHMYMILLNIFPLKYFRQIISLKYFRQMCYWKRWKKIKTRHDNLVKLGIDDYKAWEYANTKEGR